ncbi:hypothetical protein ScPMuIL_017714 [Solemya velum]
MSDSTSSETISKDTTNTVIEQSTSSLDKACQTECQISYNMKRKQCVCDQLDRNGVPDGTVSSLMNRAANSMKQSVCFLQKEEIRAIETLLNTGTVSDIANKIFNVRHLKDFLWFLFLEEVERNAQCVCKNKSNYLRRTDYDSLVNFDWCYIVDEMLLKQPLLTDILLAACTEPKKLGKTVHFDKIMKELGLIYGILMKRRLITLSRVQRVIAMSLANEKVNVKVYDRLQPLGVTVSHSIMLKVQKQVSSDIQKTLTTAVKEGKTFRLIGDNVNFMVGVSHERKDKQSHMEHWFGSAAIIQNHSFSSLSTVRPQKYLHSMEPISFIPQTDDWKTIKFTYSIILLDVLVKHFKYFKLFQQTLSELKQTLMPENINNSVSEVIPLPVLAKNEQKYSDVIDIMDSYEQLVEDTFLACGHLVTSETKVHIGGDQLTRERFSGAKRLRSGALTDKEKFTHLSPITFELFHLQMNVLQMFYKLLYNNNSTEPGTLYAEKIKLSRTHANGEDVKNHYDDCKELAVSLIDSHVVSAMLNYFAMSSVDSEPKDNFCDDMQDVCNMTNNEKKHFILRVLDTFLNQNILGDTIKFLVFQEVPQECYEMQVLLPGGVPATLFVPINNDDNLSDNFSEAPTDSVYSYAHCVLEVGLAFKCLQMNVKTPNRDNMLPFLKYLMCLLKGHSNYSKYALEILRFLCHQLSLQDKKSAHQVFYGLFVNTKGKTDTFYPADLKMEHIVRLIKGHLRAVSSNKSEKTMSARTESFSGMKKIAKQFDKISGCIHRSTRHKNPSTKSDEHLIIEDLQRVNPFSMQAGRKLPSYPKPVQSPIKKLNKNHLTAWIKGHLNDFYHEIGQ